MNHKGKNSISVILPVYNGARYLNECLSSIIHQTITPKEIIVVDDGSSDNSKAIVDKFEQVQYIRTENGGVAAARNTGIENSNGDWIAFIDQDDFWTPASLENRIRFSEGMGQKAEIIIGKQKWFLHELNSLPSWVKQEQMDKTLDGYLLGCALINRSLFEKFGVFDEAYRFSSDFDWFFRLKDAGIIFHAVEQIVLHKRIHELNESRHALLSLKELSRAIFESIKRKRIQPVEKPKLV